MHYPEMVVQELVTKSNESVSSFSTFTRGIASD